MTFSTDDIMFFIYCYTSKKSDFPPAIFVSFGSKAGGCCICCDLWSLLPPSKFFISFSTSRMKLSPPPAGEKTILSLGHVNGPNLLSGFPALLGHMKKGVVGTEVKTATPSVGVERNPLWGCRAGETMEHSPAIRLISKIFENGTSTYFHISDIKTQPALGCNINTSHIIIPKPCHHHQVAHWDSYYSAMSSDGDCCKSVWSGWNLFNHNSWVAALKMKWDYIQLN